MIDAGPVAPSVCALRAAQLGHPVLPLKPRSKLPLTAHGVKDASTDIAVVTAWFDRVPDANYGIATGGALVVVDVDGEPGRASLRGVSMPATVTVSTGKGWHYYYRSPRPLGCRVGLRPGVDVRGDGGYVVGPGSIHPSGYRYQCLPDLRLGEMTIADAPAWLTDSLTSARVARPAGEWESVVREGVGEGGRNATVASIAGHLLRRDVDAGVVAELMLAFNAAKCRPPLPGSEVRMIVDSICAAELRRRGGAG